MTYTLCNIGDVILADRGFTCQEHVGMFMAEIKMPPFTKGKNSWRKVLLTGAVNYLWFTFMLRG